MKLKLITMIALFISLTLSMASYAQDGTDRLTGIVTVTRGAEGEISSVTLNAESYDENDDIVSVTYKIELDEMGKQLGEKHDGEEVQVTGTIKADTMVVAGFSASNDGMVDDIIEEEPVEEIEIDMDEAGYEEAPDME
jgi:hypothetical protein